MCFTVVADEWVGWRPHLAKVELIESGNPHPTGLGAVRGLWRMGQPVDGPPQVTDVCNHYRPPYLYGYKIIGLEPPVIDHGSIVVLFRPRDGGTEIVLHSTGVTIEYARTIGMADDIRRVVNANIESRFGGLRCRVRGASSGLTADSCVVAAAFDSGLWRRKPGCKPPPLLSGRFIRRSAVAGQAKGNR